MPVNIAPPNTKNPWAEAAERMAEAFRDAREARRKQEADQAKARQKLIIDVAAQPDPKTQEALIADAESQPNVYGKLPIKSVASLANNPSMPSMNSLMQSNVQRTITGPNSALMQQAQANLEQTRSSTAANTASTARLDEEAKYATPQGRRRYLETAGFVKPGEELPKDYADYTLTGNFAKVDQDSEQFTRMQKALELGILPLMGDSVNVSGKSINTKEAQAAFNKQYRAMQEDKGLAKPSQALTPVESALRDVGRGKSGAKGAERDITDTANAMMLQDETVKKGSRRISGWDPDANDGAGGESTVDEPFPQPTRAQAAKYRALAVEQLRLGGYAKAMGQSDPALDPTVVVDSRKEEVLSILEKLKKPGRP